MDNPDKVDYGIRFGCGFLIGIPLAFLFLVRLRHMSGRTAVVVVLVGALIFGVLAARYGDRLYEAVFRKGPWV